MRVGRGRCGGRGGDGILIRSGRIRLSCLKTIGGCCVRFHLHLFWALEDMLALVYPSMASIGMGGSCIHNRIGHEQRAVRKDEMKNNLCF